VDRLIKGGHSIRRKNFYLVDIPFGRVLRVAPDGTWSIEFHGRHPSTELRILLANSSIQIVTANMQTWSQRYDFIRLGDWCLPTDHDNGPTSGLAQPSWA
jgi:hypothetical protein